jgi:hypothetical protein
MGDERVLYSKDKGLFYQDGLGQICRRTPTRDKKRIIGLFNRVIP